MQHKICIRCKTKKPVTDFGIRVDNKKRRGICRKCQNRDDSERRFRSLKRNIRYKLKKAKRRWEVLVDWQYIEALYHTQDGRCALTGRSIGWDKKNSLSIDRIDNNLPYIEGNIQLVCKEANYAKHTLAQEAFILLCRDVAKRFG